MKTLSQGRHLNPGPPKCKALSMAVRNNWQYLQHLPVTISVEANRCGLTSHLSTLNNYQWQLVWYYRHSTTYHQFCCRKARTTEPGQSKFEPKTSRTRSRSIINWTTLFKIIFQKSSDVQHKKQNQQQTFTGPVVYLQSICSLSL
jgi:hypothetical protein